MMPSVMRFTPVHDEFYSEYVDIVNMADFNLAEAWANFQDLLNQNHVPEICLAIMGVITLAIVFAYKDDKESTSYKLLVALGVIFGAFMVYVSMAVDTGWGVGTLIICIVACFTLIIRPFREVRIDIVVGLLALAWMYVYLGTLDGATIDFLFDIDLSFLADGIPRIVVAVIVGALAYMVTGFATGLALLIGKILNAWPFLLVLSIWCIAEAVLLIAGYGSVYDFLVTYFQ